MTPPPPLRDKVPPFADFFYGSPQWFRLVPTLRCHCKDLCSSSCLPWNPRSPIILETSMKPAMNRKKIAYISSQSAHVRSLARKSKRDRRTDRHHRKVVQDCVAGRSKVGVTPNVNISPHGPKNTPRHVRSATCHIETYNTGQDSQKFTFTFTFRMKCGPIVFLFQYFDLRIRWIAFKLQLSSYSDVDFSGKCNLGPKCFCLFKFVCIQL